MINFLKKNKTQEKDTFEQQCIKSFNKAKLEFKVGDICYCNGFDTLCGVFMNADKGQIKGFDESRKAVKVYLYKEEETVFVLPELVFFTKEEALREREIYAINRRKENAKNIEKLKGTTISEYINKYGIEPSDFADEILLDIKNHNYYAIRISFGHIDEFIHAYFIAPNLTKKDNLEIFQKQFEQYCYDHNYTSDCILSMSVQETSNDRDEFQWLVDEMNQILDNDTSEERDC